MRFSVDGCCDGHIYPDDTQWTNAMLVLRNAEQALGKLAGIVEVIKLRWVIGEETPWRAMFEVVVITNAEQSIFCDDPCRQSPNDKSSTILNRMTLAVRDLAREHTAYLENRPRTWREKSSVS